MLEIDKKRKEIAKMLEEDKKRKEIAKMLVEDKKKILMKEKPSILIPISIVGMIGFVISLIWMIVIPKEGWPVGSIGLSLFIFSVWILIAISPGSIKLFLKVKPVIVTPPSAQPEI